MKLPWHLIVLDIETNGGRNHDARIVEIGAVCLDEDFDTAGEYEALVDGRPMLPQATAVNNITDAMLEGKPKWEGRWREFAGWCDQWRPYILGQWSEFDVSVLRPEYARIGVRYPHPGHAWDLKSVVWWECLKLGYPSRTFPVDRACEILGIRFDGQKHRALPDARAEAKCFRAVAKPAPAKAEYL